MSENLVKLRLPEVQIQETKELKINSFDCLAIPVYSEENSKIEIQIDFSSSKELKNLISTNNLEKLIRNLTDFKAKHNQVSEFIVLNQNGNALKLLFYGLGEKKELKELNSFRKVFANVARQAKKASKLALVLPDLDFPETDLFRAACETTSLAPYKFEKYKTTAKQEEQETKLERVSFFKQKINDLKQVETQLKKSKISSRAVLFARELIAEPPNIVNPEYLEKISKQIQRDSQDNNLSLKVLNKRDCEKLKMGAFLAVASGATTEPRLIHFHYKPESESKKHIALVGKGVTFDSGGLSLKTPSKYMEKMKYDMSGAATVIGLMSIISELKPNVEVTALVAACENMPDGNSFRTGDVVVSRSGKTIEVLNTDAEGRVTLADSVYYACEQNPDQIIDLATLTGAVVVALGEVCAGAMTNNQELLKNLEKSFSIAGERIWELPMYEEYEEYIKSDIADMINTGSKGQAGPQNGAVFIKQFVSNNRPWVHLDIAGACWPERTNTHFTSKNNPAGFGVLGLIEYLTSF